MDRKKTAPPTIPAPGEFATALSKNEAERVSLEAEYAELQAELKSIQARIGVVADRLQPFRLSKNPSRISAGRPNLYPRKKPSQR